MHSNSDSLKSLWKLVESNKITNNPTAIKYARIALSLARKSNSPADLLDGYQWIGKAFFQNQKDSSYYYYNLALHFADSANLVKQKINIYYFLARIYTAAYNYKDAMAQLDSSIRLSELVKDPEGLSNAYIALGNIKYNAHDYDNARLMFESALKVARNDSLYKQISAALSNLARQPFEKDVKRMISRQKEALSNLSHVTGVEEEMASILINIGNLYPKQPDSALYYYKGALNLTMHAKLPKILFGVSNNMAYSYLDKGDISKAESCLRDQAIPLAIELKDNDWLATLYDTYADVCEKKGDYKSAFNFQSKSVKARRIDTQQKAADQIRLLAALLDLKSKEIIIQNEAREILVQSNRLKQVELLLTISLLLVIASVFLIFFLQQRNRARMQKEQINSAKRIIEMEETEKGRTARELHDLTGQLVLGISGTIENIDFPDQEIKEQIKERIKELGGRIRKISHRMNRAMIEHFTFNEMISGLCEDVEKFSKLQIDLQISDEFPDMPNELVLHLYRITQELLTNAGKYARDSQVKINIYSNNEKLFLYYSDNGPGFKMTEKSKPSMGILNIFERAKLVGGKANLSSEPGKGTSWEIIFPLNKTNTTKS